MKREEPPAKEPQIRIIDAVLNELAPCPIVVKLDVAPCPNGIVQKGMEVIESGKKCVVTRLYFDSVKNKAMCEAMRCDDDDTVVFTPLNKLSLEVQNFYKSSHDMPYANLESLHPINEVFHILAAVKRAIGMSFGKTNAFWAADLCPSSATARKLLGFRTHETRNSVSYLHFLMHSHAGLF